MRSKGKAGVCLLWAIAAMSISHTANATTVKRFTLSQMTQGATLVVEGTVASKSARWDETGRYIITEVRINVAQTLKGKSAGPVTVRVLGGEVGKVGQYVADSPKFVEGEEVLLLLEPHPIKDWRIVGFHQGKFSISSNPKTGMRHVSGPAIPTAMPLEDMEARIKAFVQGK